MRLNEGALVNFAFDPKTLPAGATTSTLRVAYFDGDGWEYVNPASIDTATGRVSFTTYHFSLFGLAQVKDETKLTEQWVHSKTLDKQLRKNINKVSDHVADQVIDLTLQKMGIDDKTVKGKILSEILKDDSYKEIIDAGKDGDLTDLTQKVVVLAGKKSRRMYRLRHIKKHCQNSQIKSVTSRL
jgi:hypothetical protein